MLGKHAHAILLALDYVRDKWADPEVGQTSSFEQTAEGLAEHAAGSAPARGPNLPRLAL